MNALAEGRRPASDLDRAGPVEGGLTGEAVSGPACLRSSSCAMDGVIILPHSDPRTGVR
jgi:hypothetical protein